MEVLRVLFRVNRRAGPIGGGAFPPSDRRQAGAAGGRRGGPRPCRGLWRRDRLPSPAVFVRRNETVSVVPLRLHALGDDEGVHRYGALAGGADEEGRSEEHTSELQSLMRISYAVFCLKKKIKQIKPKLQREEHITTNK